MNTSKSRALVGLAALVLAAGSLSGCFGSDEDCESSALTAVVEKPGGGSGGRGGARSGSRGSKGKATKGKRPGGTSGVKPAGHDDDCDDD